LQGKERKEKKKKKERWVKIASLTEYEEERKSGIRA